jgi:predicted nucleic acid-binding protein
VTYVVYDTDVSSMILRRRLPASMAVRLAGTLPYITFVTLGELTQWAELRHWGPRTRAGLDEWLSGVGFLEYDREVARTWGRLSARGHQRGRPRPTNDMWIAACCLAAGLPLATLNVKDFADFAEYDGLRLIGRD